MKKVLLFVLLIMINYYTAFTQIHSANITTIKPLVSPGEHNALVKAAMLNFKEIIEDKDFIQSAKENHLLLLLSKMEFIPIGIRRKILNSSNNITKTGGTVSKKDFSLYINLIKSINSSSTIYSKIGILNKYSKRFSSKRLNYGVAYALEILKAGSKDIYNATFYIQHGLFPGVNPTAVQRGIDNMAQADIKGAVTGAITGSVFPGPGTLACAAVGAPAASIAAGIWEIITFFTDPTDGEGIPLGPAMQEGMDAVQNAIDQSSTCTAGENNFTKFSDPKSIKEFYENAIQPNVISILGRRTFVSQTNKSSCISLYPGCVCVTEPCNCPNQICVPINSIISVKSTNFFTLKGERLYNFSFRAQTIVSDNGQSVLLKNYITNKLK